MINRIKYNLGKFTALKILPILGISIPPLPAVCAIITNGKKILAIDLSYKKGYSLPGGGLMARETFEEALIREVKEETNLNVALMKYLSSHKAYSETLSHVSVCFLTKVKNLQDLKASHEGQPIWMDPKDLYHNAAYIDVKKHLKSFLVSKSLAWQASKG